MKKIIKILNLYAGIGGNRKQWEKLADELNVILEVTAVELNEKIAQEYKENFPNDKVIVTDAHEYLLSNATGYDFIWSSRPCVSHSRINLSYKNNPVNKPRYIDCKLYEEIIFLTHFFDGLWCVENVIPYYEPLIPTSIIIGRHSLWSNFNISDIETKKGTFGSVNGKCMKNWSGKKRIEDRNAVDSKIGLHILECAYGIESKPLLKFMQHNESIAIK